MIDIFSGIAKWPEEEICISKGNFIGVETRKTRDIEMSLDGYSPKIRLVHPLFLKKIRKVKRNNDLLSLCF